MVDESHSDLILELADLEFEQGGHLLAKHALRSLSPGQRLRISGCAPDLKLHLEAWCRNNGDGFLDPGPDHPTLAYVVRGESDSERWDNAERAGSPDVDASSVIDTPSAHWGVAPRGALVETGGPRFDFTLDRKEVVWSDELPALYRQAVAAQWDPFRDVPWEADFHLPDEVEDAVVQLMTYLVENENAALLIPARFLGRLHPHFKEVMQLLSIQTADEARHVEVFSRRAALRRSLLGLSTVGGQASLKTLFDEADFALAMFLLSVLGEGSFLSLLKFVHDNAPDPVTARITQLAARDESRHVAFGMAHLSRHLQVDPALKGRLVSAIERRHAHLQATAGLNAEVFDALLLVAAGSWDLESIREGNRKVLALVEDMDLGRQRRLRQLGFSDHEARELSSLHTRNFM